MSERADAREVAQDDAARAAEQEAAEQGAAQTGKETRVETKLTLVAPQRSSDF